MGIGGFRSSHPQAVVWWVRPKAGLKSDNLVPSHQPIRHGFNMVSSTSKAGFAVRRPSYEGPAGAGVWLCRCSRRRQTSGAAHSESKLAPLILLAACRLLLDVVSFLAVPYHLLHLACRSKNRQEEVSRAGLMGSTQPALCHTRDRRQPWA